jgi:hypothetical protein
MGRNRCCHYGSGGSSPLLRVLTRGRKRRCNHLQNSNWANLFWDSFCQFSWIGYRDDFLDWKIVQCTRLGVQVYVTLAESSSVFSIDSIDASWRERIASILGENKCLILHSFHTPTHYPLLQAKQNIQGLPDILMALPCPAVTSRQRMILLGHFIGCPNPSSSIIRGLKALPIFPCEARSGLSNTFTTLLHVDLVMISDGCWSLPTLSLPVTFLKPVDGSTLLYSALGIPVMSHAQYISTHVAVWIVKIGQDCPVLLHALSVLNTSLEKTYSVDQATIVDRLSKVAFVPSASGGLVSPKGLLVDAEIPAAFTQALGNSLLHPDIASNRVAISILTKLGLRSRMSASELHASALYIEQAYSETNTCTPESLQLSLFVTRSFAACQPRPPPVGYFHRRKWTYYTPSFQIDISTLELKIFVAIKNSKWVDSLIHKKSPVDYSDMTWVSCGGPHRLATHPLAPLCSESNMILHQDYSDIIGSWAISQGSDFLVKKLSVDYRPSDVKSSISCNPYLAHSRVLKSQPLPRQV